MRKTQHAQDVANRWFCVQLDRGETLVRNFGVAQAFLPVKQQKIWPNKRMQSDKVPATRALCR